MNPTIAIIPAKTPAATVTSPVEAEWVIEGTSYLFQGTCQGGQIAELWLNIGGAGWIRRVANIACPAEVWSAYWTVATLGTWEARGRVVGPRGYAYSDIITFGCTGA